MGNGNGNGNNNSSVVVKDEKEEEWNADEDGCFLLLFLFLLLNLLVRRGIKQSTGRFSASSSGLDQHGAAETPDCVWVRVPKHRTAGQVTPAAAHDERASHRILDESTAFQS